MKGQSETSPASFLWLIIPCLVVAAARWGGGTALAGQYPRLAATLFVWIAADALILSLMARSPDRRPSPDAVLGRLAAAASIVLIGAPVHVRTGLFSMPVLIAALALVIAAHLCRTVGKIFATWRSATGSPSAHASAVLRAVVPAAFLRLAALELTVLRIALLQWTAAPDVPAGTRAFAYHRHMAPMMAVLLTLQAIEIIAVDLLVRLWNPIVAAWLLGLGIVGLVYLAGLVKSLRLRPILLTDQGLLLRSGILQQRLVPYWNIASIASQVEGHEVKAAATLDMSLLTWPNIVIRLNEPVIRKALQRPRPPIRAIAFRVDTPEPFLACLSARLYRECS